jgi:hypothetical protein
MARYDGPCLTQVRPGLMAGTIRPPAVRVIAGRRMRGKRRLSAVRGL